MSMDINSGVISGVIVDGLSTKEVDGKTIGTFAIGSEADFYKDGEDAKKHDVFFVNISESKIASIGHNLNKGRQVTVSYQLRRRKTDKGDVIYYLAADKIMLGQQGAGKLLKIGVAAAHEKMALMTPFTKGTYSKDVREVLKLLQSGVFKLKNEIDDAKNPRIDDIESSSQFVRLEAGGLIVLASRIIEMCDENEDENNRP